VCCVFQLFFKIMVITVFCDVTLCSLVDTYRHNGGHSVFNFRFNYTKYLVQDLHYYPPMYLKIPDFCSILCFLFQVPVSYLFLKVIQ
jgi:hypothetical protein